MLFPNHSSLLFYIVLMEIVGIFLLFFCRIIGNFGIFECYIAVELWSQ